MLFSLCCALQPTRARAQLVCVHSAQHEVKYQQNFGRTTYRKIEDTNNMKLGMGHKDDGPSVGLSISFSAPSRNFTYNHLFCFDAAVRRRKKSSDNFTFISLFFLLLYNVGPRKLIPFRSILCYEKKTEQTVLLSVIASSFEILFSQPRWLLLLSFRVTSNEVGL